MHPSADDLVVLALFVIVIVLAIAGRPRRRPVPLQRIGLPPRARHDPRAHFTVTPPVYDWSDDPDMNHG